MAKPISGLGKVTKLGIKEVHFKQGEQFYTCKWAV